MSNLCKDGALWNLLMRRRSLLLLKGVMHAAGGGTRDALYSNYRLWAWSATHVRELHIDSVYWLLHVHLERVKNWIITQNLAILFYFIFRCVPSNIRIQRCKSPASALLNTSTSFLPPKLLAFDWITSPRFIKVQTDFSFPKRMCAHAAVMREALFT